MPSSSYPFARPLLGTLDGIVPVQDVQDLGEGHLIVVAIGKHSLHQAALFRLGRFQGVDQRQRDFAFAQVVADRLAQNFFPRSKIQDVID